MRSQPRKEVFAKLELNVGSDQFKLKELLSIVCASVGMVSGLEKDDIHVSNYASSGHRTEVDFTFTSNQAVQKVCLLGEHVRSSDSPLHNLPELKNVYSGASLKLLCHTLPRNPLQTVSQQFKTEFNLLRSQKAGSQKVDASEDVHKQADFLESVSLPIILVGPVLSEKVTSAHHSRFILPEVRSFSWLVSSDLDVDRDAEGIGQPNPNESVPSVDRGIQTQTRASVYLPRLVRKSSEHIILRSNIGKGRIESLRPRLRMFLSPHVFCGCNEESEKLILSHSPASKELPQSTFSVYRQDVPTIFPTGNKQLSTTTHAGVRLDGGKFSSLGSVKTKVFHESHLTLQSSEKTILRDVNVTEVSEMKSPIEGVPYVKPEAPEEPAEAVPRVYNRFREDFPASTGDDAPPSFVIRKKAIDLWDN
jgi:hypothetical protein